MTKPHDVLVTISHMRRCPSFTDRVGFCSGRSRDAFKRYGLDWREFVVNGLPASRLRATGDALIIRVVEFAEQEANRGQQ